MNYRKVGGGDEVYDDAVRRANDGCVVCLLPAIDGDGFPATFTGWTLPNVPQPMPPIATDSNPARRAAFLIAYAIHTRRSHSKEVTFRC